MKAIESVLYTHIESGGDRAFLFVSTDEEVAVRSPSGRVSDRRAAEKSDARRILGPE